MMIGAPSSRRRITWYCVGFFYKMRAHLLP